MKSEIIRIWYKTVVETKILYNVINWYPYLNKKKKEKINRIQRLYLLRILNCYKSTSSQALYCITGIPPLTTTIEQLIKMDQIKRNNLAFTIEDNVISIQNIEEKTYKNEKNPTIYPNNINFTTTYNNITSSIPNLQNNNLHIFTDGSKTESGTGYAILAIKDYKIISTKLRKLHKLNTVFQAEASAIEESILIFQDSQEEIIEIYTDSLSSILSLQNILPKSKIINKILKICEDTSHKIINFHWIKAHCDSIGNEQVDKLAKLATSIDEITPIPYPRSLLKKYFNNEIMKKWQHDWSNSDKGRHTFNICPTIKPKLRFTSLATIYFITGHGSFPTFLFKIKKLNSPNCECGKLGEPHHFSTEPCSFFPVYIKKAPNESYLAYYKII